VAAGVEVGVQLAQTSGTSGPAVLTVNGMGVSVETAVITGVGYAPPIVHVRFRV
jgi:hypothetical protein